VDCHLRAECLLLAARNLEGRRAVAVDQELSRHGYRNGVSVLDSRREQPRAEDMRERNCYMLFITNYCEAPRADDQEASSSACSPLEQAIAPNPLQHPSADRSDILKHRRDLSHALPLLLTNENAIKHDWPFVYAIHFSTPVHYCRAIIVPCLHLPLECPSVPRLLFSLSTYSTYIGGLTLCKRHTLGLSLHSAWLTSSRHCYYLPNCRG
jgi:hypothetical protein